MTQREERRVFSAPDDSAASSRQQRLRLRLRLRVGGGSFEGDLKLGVVRLRTGVASVAEPFVEGGGPFMVRLPVQVRDAGSGPRLHRSHQTAADVLSSVSLHDVHVVQPPEASSACRTQSRAVVLSGRVTNEVTSALCHHDQPPGVLDESVVWAESLAVV